MILFQQESHHPVPEHRVNVVVVHDDAVPDSRRDTPGCIVRSFIGSDFTKVMEAATSFAKRIENLDLRKLVPATGKLRQVYVDRFHQKDMEQTYVC